MKVLFLLLQFSLFNYAISFITRKLTTSYPIPLNVIINPEQQTSNYAARGSDIKSSFLANDGYKNGEDISSIGNVIKSFKIPGFNVYRIVFDREDTGNHENPILSPNFKTEAISKNANRTDEYLSNVAFEKKNDSDTLYFNKINKVPDSESILDQRFIEINCGGQNSTDKGKCNEETTTHTNEVTTTIDISNENSTLMSDYDDESYGTLSDRSEISPSLLASLVG